MGRADRRISIVKLDLPRLLTGIGWFLAASFTVHIALRLAAPLTEPLGASFLGELLETIERLVDVDGELNIPTYVASFLLTTEALAMGTIAALLLARRAEHGRLWFGLSVVFAFGAVDEVAVMHETFIRPLRELLDLDGVFYFAWVLPGMAFVALVALLSVRMLLDLPRGVRFGFLLGAAVFALGGLGMEMVGGLIYSAADLGRESLAYFTIVTLEEGLEFTGVIVMIRALLSYLRDDLVGDSRTLQLVLK